MTETLTGRVRREAGAFLFLVAAGIALGNPVLVYLSLVPFLFLVFALALPAPEISGVTRSASASTVITNEVIGVSVTLHPGGGPGIVTVADALPEHFELSEGSNFHVYWHDGKNLPPQFAYQVRCTRRGVYGVGPAQLECFQNSWVGHRASDSGEIPLELVVRPPSASLRKIRDPRLRSRMPMPSGATYRLGVRTTDFMDIREYRPGDPFSTINWKATARLSGAGSTVPCVNEYEKDGKKTIMIFLDASARMSLGSTVDNVFEHAIQAASGIASFYLDQGMRVGVYAYHFGEFILPETGRKQASLITRSLIDIQIAGDPAGENENGLDEAVIECSGHLSGANPLFFIITTIDHRNAGEVIGGIRMMQRYSFNARLPRVIVLDISGYGLAARGACEQAASTLLDMDARPYVRLIRKAGAIVAPFDPLTQKVSQVLMATGRRRSH